MGRGQDGRGDRDRFIVEWKTGKAWYPEEADKEVVSVTNGHDEETATNGHYEDTATNGHDETATIGHYDQDTMEDSDSSAASSSQYLFSCSPSGSRSFPISLISISFSNCSR